MVAKVFYVAEKLLIFSKLGALIPPIAFVLLSLPLLHKYMYILLHYSTSVFVQNGNHLAFFL